MNIFKRLANAITGKNELSDSQMRRIAQEVNRAIYSWTIGNNSAIPINDNPESYIKDGFDKNAYVYAVITYISEKASVLPMKLVRELSNGEEEEIEESRAWDIWHKPNSTMTGAMFRATSMCFLLTTGNAYMWGVKLRGGLNSGSIGAIEYQPSQHMEIISSNDTIISGYQLNDNKQQKFDKDEIGHVKLVNLQWGNKQNLYGQSPLKAGGMIVEGDNANVASRQKLSKNDGAKGLITPKENLGMTQTDAKTMERSVDKKTNGNHNKGRIAYANTPVEYHQFGMSARDLETIQNSTLSKQDICLLYGVSSILFNDMSASTYDNYNTAEKSAMTNSILKYFQIWLDVYNDMFVKPYEDGAYFKVSLKDIEVLQPDLKERIQALKDAYWIPNSTKQEMSGIEVQDDLPEYLVPANLIPAEDLEGGDEGEVQKRYGDYNGRNA